MVVCHFSDVTKLCYLKTKIFIIRLWALLPWEPWVDQSCACVHTHSAPRPPQKGIHCRSFAGNEDRMNFESLWKVCSWSCFPSKMTGSKTSLGIYSCDPRTLGAVIEALRCHTSLIWDDVSKQAPLCDRKNAFEWVKVQPIGYTLCEVETKLLHVLCKTIYYTHFSLSVELEKSRRKTCYMVQKCTKQILIILWKVANCRGVKAFDVHMFPIERQIVFIFLGYIHWTHPWMNTTCALLHPPFCPLGERIPSVIVAWFNGRKSRQTLILMLFSCGVTASRVILHAAYIFSSSSALHLDASDWAFSS